MVYIYIYIHISEVGGSEFAFRQAPRNREIVSCRACMRAKGLRGADALKMSSGGPALFPSGSTVFPFPFPPILLPIQL